MFPDLFYQQKKIALACVRIDSQRVLPGYTPLKMSQITSQEVLAAKRPRCRSAGLEHKSKIINRLVEFFGFYLKAPIGALQDRPALHMPFVRERPAE